MCKHHGKRVACHIINEKQISGSPSLWGNPISVGAREVRSGRGRHPGDGVQAFMDAVWGTVWPARSPNGCRPNF